MGLPRSGSSPGSTFRFHTWRSQAPSRHTGIDSAHRRSLADRLSDRQQATPVCSPALIAACTPATCEHGSPGITSMAVVLSGGMHLSKFNLFVNIAQVFHCRPNVRELRTVLPYILVTRYKHWPTSFSSAYFYTSFFVGLQLAETKGWHLSFVFNSCQLLMGNSRVKLKRNINKASPCVRPF
jgi:hypothetical protein